MLKRIEVYKNESMAKHTTFNIGGVASFFILPKNIYELRKVIDFCIKNNKKWFIVGNGSNLLVSDNGYNGVVISLKKFNKIKILKNQIVKVDAGVNLFALNKYLADNDLSGLEWSYGIPGSVGGGVYMNAGAFNHSIGETIKEVTILKNGQILKKRGIDFNYRDGKVNPQEIVLSVKIKAKKGQKCDILLKMNEFLNIRKEKQPYENHSAGSVFKRDEEYMPAKVIDEMGLKGLRIGDAMISTKHAGFIVNLGNASCEEVRRLIEIIKKLAKSEGYIFNEEIIFLD